MLYGNRRLPSAAQIGEMTGEEFTEILQSIGLTVDEYADMVCSF